MTHRLTRTVVRILAGLLALVVLATAVLFIVNRRAPTASNDPQTLSAETLAHMAEFDHLRRELGNRVWPGYGDAPVPVLLYNEQTAFLAGLTDPADGWRTVPDGQAVGSAWEILPDVTVSGQPVYQAPLPLSGDTPQAFTVRVGDAWAASMTTLEWMRIGLAQQIRSDLPESIAAVFPYGLFLNQLVSGSDQFISLIAHESFHAYQGRVAPDRLRDAEESLREEQGYPWDDASLTAAWQSELDLLAEGLRAQTVEKTAAAAADFLALRGQRRAEAGLTPRQIDFERQREWLEGQARYMELALWRAAAQSADYTPAAATQSLTDFSGYATFDTRWDREIEQLSRMANDPGEGRFYYTGMAMAMMLDRLQPGWQNRALEPGVYLEDLLAEAVED